MSILMSAENPTGYKLEELLTQIQLELEQKNHKIMNSTCPIVPTIIENNNKIISFLERSVRIQNETMQELEKNGPNAGPTGKARI